MTERRTRFDAYAAGRADGEADRAAGEAAVWAWAARRPSRWSWQVWAAGGVAVVGAQHLRAPAQRRRARRAAPGSIPPVLLAPGRIALDHRADERRWRDYQR